ncbi:hypothetical protein [Rhodococcus pyridinivorans]|uniref:hypothetical protein n=1 Tax=Rhodococcus pyridinivorans TaxID=103816 RepID=UPI0037C7391B
MAGPAAAHELIERGFEVTVFEPTALGGKARSTPPPAPRQAAASICPVNTASASSPASTSTSPTRCDGSRSPETRTACSTNSLRDTASGWRSPARPTSPPRPPSHRCASISTTR